MVASDRELAFTKPGSDNEKGLQLLGGWDRVSLDVQVASSGGQPILDGGGALDIDHDPNLFAAGAMPV